MNYHILDSHDLRAFDNREKDYGVHNYLETLGFVPDAVTLLECSVEQRFAAGGEGQHRRGRGASVAGRSTCVLPLLIVPDELRQIAAAKQQSRQK